MMILLVLLISQILNGIVARSVDVVTIAVDRPEEWNLVESKSLIPNTDELLECIIVTKSNPNQVEQLRRKLDQVSNPRDKENYGKYMTINDIHKTILTDTRPTGEKIEKWLVEQKQQGIQIHTIKPSAHNEFIKIRLPVNAAEKLFQAKFRRHRNVVTNQMALRSETYSLPLSIHTKVAWIHGISAFPSRITRHKKESVTKRNIQLVRSKRATSSNAPIIQKVKFDLHKRGQLFVQLICQNGEEARLTICPNFQGLQIFVKLQQTPTLFTTVLSRTDLITHSLSCVPCTNSTVSSTCNSQGLNESAIMCTMSIDKSRFKNYFLYQFSVRSLFGNGTNTTEYSNIGIYRSLVFRSLPLVPGVAMAMYNITYGGKYAKRSPLLRQGVAGFSSQYINRASIKSFARVYAKKFNLNVGKIYGKNNASNPGDESTIDMEFMSAMGSGIPTDFISIGPLFDGLIFDWIIKILEMAQDPSILLPRVHTFSYSTDEPNYGTSYIDIMETKLMSLGLAGFTMFVASGDDGTSSRTLGCGATGLAQYPSSSAYMTSVGGTLFVRSSTNTSCRYVKQERGVCLQEVVASLSDQTLSSITSGGGFSAYIGQPDYQKAFVDRYLNISGKQIPPSTFFNKLARAYPDISFAAVNFVETSNGQSFLVDGTSGASPAIAGVFSLINDYRLQHGLPFLGFLNPTLYYIAKCRPDAFHDITVGDNRCNKDTCCKYGFYAQPSFDAVSGLGSINFPVLFDILTKPLNISAN
ncbi:unnamed protein product, partial [Didymodactylos carnosus]